MTRHPESKPTIRSKVVFQTDVAWQIFQSSAETFRDHAERVYELTGMYGERRVMLYMRKILDALENELNEMNQELIQNGIDMAPEYSHPWETEVAFTTSMFAYYIRVLRLIDDLVQRMDALWLSGMVDHNQRAEFIGRWWYQRKRLLLFISNCLKDAEAQRDQPKEPKEKVALAASA